MLFFKGFLQSFYAPARLYREVSHGRKYNSWLCVLIYCLIYVGASLWLYFNGYTPFEDPWIRLPGEIYYLVQSFYIIPLGFLMWILGTGTIHVISKLFGGKGSFDRLFRMTGYSLWAPWYLLIIVDCIHSTPGWIYNTILVVCILLVLTGTTVATKTEVRIHVPGAFVSSFLSVISIGIILFTYIR